MTKTDLATFRELLRAKQIELSGKSLSLERIAIERSTMSWRRIRSIIGTTVRSPRSTSRSDSFSQMNSFRISKDSRTSGSIGRSTAGS